MSRKPTLLFAVCHPDDEALWVGGLLHGLSTTGLARCLVVCLSGRDPASPRAEEFEAARLVAGYERGVVLGFPLRPATEPLPPTAATLEEGLDELGLQNGDVDLLVTHPANGDEHMHPHHVQAHHELAAWAAAAAVPLSFFSTVPLPHIEHVPELGHLRRRGPLHLTMLARCVGRDAPHSYAQFAADPAAKRAQLECYRSIDLAEHERAYGSFTSPVEGLYLVDESAAAAFQAVVEGLEIVEPEDQFAALRQPVSGARSVVSRLRRGLR